MSGVKGKREMFCPLADSPNVCNSQRPNSFWVSYVGGRGTALEMSLAASQDAQQRQGSEWSSLTSTPTCGAGGPGCGSTCCAPMPTRHSCILYEGWETSEEMWSREKLAESLGSEMSCEGGCRDASNLGRCTTTAFGSTLVQEPDRKAGGLCPDCSEQHIVARTLGTPWQPRLTWRS